MQSRVSLAFWSWSGVVADCVISSTVAISVKSRNAQASSERLIGLPRWKNISSNRLEMLWKRLTPSQVVVWKIGGMLSGISAFSRSPLRCSPRMLHE